MQTGYVCLLYFYFGHRNACASVNITSCHRQCEPFQYNVCGCLYYYKNIYSSWLVKGFGNAVHNILYFNSIKQYDGCRILVCDREYIFTCNIFSVRFLRLVSMRQNNVKVGREATIGNNQIGTFFFSFDFLYFFLFSLQ